jgi:hypothetical protein
MLPELQRAMGRGLRQPAEQAEILATIRDAAGLSPAQQLAVYRSSLIAGMARALAYTYPICQRLVGENFFLALATSFIHTHPSRAPDLNYYGADFADFLRDFEPARSLPYLPDVARLEWLWQSVFTARNTRPLTLAALARLSEARRERLQLRLLPASGLLASPFPVHRIWAVNQDGYAGDPTVDLAEGAVRLMVWRTGMNMRMQALNAAEWALLEAIGAGQTLTTACRQISEDLPQTELAALLAGAIASGWMTASRGHGR